LSDDIDNRTPTWPLWAAILVFACCSLYVRLFELVGIIYLAPLAIPLAAWLGVRYRRRGLWVVLFGGLFLVPGIAFNDYSGFQPALDIWLVAVAACLVAASDRPLSRILPGARPGHFALSLFLLLPVTIGLIGKELSRSGLLDEMVLELAVHLHYVFYVGLFIAGAAGIRPLRIVVLLLGALLIGITAKDFGAPWTAASLLDARRADLPMLGLVELEQGYLWYAFHTITAFLTAVAFYASGRLSGEFVRSRRPPSFLASLALVLAVAVLAVRIVPFGWLTGVLEQGVGTVLDVFRGADAVPAGEPGTMTVADRWRSPLNFPVRPLFPLLGFVSAFLLGRRGVLTGLAALAGLWVLDSAVEGYFPRLVLPAGDLLALLGFAALGVGARNRQLDTSQRWWSTGWAVYLLLVLIITLQSLPPNLAAYLPLVLAGAIGLGWGLVRLRRWLHGRPIRPSPGWVALFSLVGVLTVVRSHLGAMWEALRQLAGAGGVATALTLLEDAWGMVFAALLTLWLLLSALQVLVARLPELIADLRRAWELLTAVLRRRRSVPETSEHGPADSIGAELVEGSSAASGPDSAYARAPDGKTRQAGSSEPSASRATPTPGPGQPHGRAAPPRWWQPVRLIKTLRAITMWVAIGTVAAGLWRPVAEVADELREEWREAREPRAPSDYALSVEPNPELLAAALEILAPRGIERRRQGPYRTEIETGWYVDPATPHVRRRVEVRIGSGREARDVDARVDIQRRRYGLWVEANGEYERERAEAEALEAELLRRAETLAEG
jgi:hypothetical protein